MTGIVAGENTDESISLRSTSRITVHLNNNTNAIHDKMELNSNRKIMIKIVIDFIVILCGKIFIYNKNFKNLIMKQYFSWFTNFGFIFMGCTI